MSLSSANRNSTANPILLKIKVVGNGVRTLMSDCGTRCAKAGGLEFGEEEVLKMPIKRC